MKLFEAGRNIFKKPPKSIWRWFFLAECLISLIAFAFLLTIPSDAKRAIFLGYSPIRFLALVLTIFLTIVSFLGFISFYRKAKLHRILIKTLEPGDPKGFFRISAVFIALLCLIIFIIFPLIQNPKIIIYLSRLIPLVAWLFCTCLNIIFFLNINEFDDYKKNLHIRKSNLKIVIYIIILVLGILGFISISRLGLIPDPAYWDAIPPVPLLEWQILLVLLIFILIFIFKILLNSSKKLVLLSRTSRFLKIIDFSIFLCLWITAVLLWTSQPVPNSYFTPKVRPPNYEIYPFSDARIFDSNAQSILVGNMAQDEYVIRKPLHSIFLAFLHAVGGQKYEIIAFLQTIVLALIPSILFLLGAELRNRFVGLALGISAIFLELNTLSVASLTTTSNTKLLMTEIPTSLLLSLLVLVVVKWQNNKKNRSIYSSLIGSVTGALILTRSQSLILIPFIALIFYITALKSWKRIVIYICLFALGIALVVTPWLYRNYQISGHFALEDSRNTSDMVNRIMGKPVETYQGIYILDNPEQVLFKQVFASYLNHPLETLKFIGNHFFNNMISSIRILPIRTELIKNFDSIFRLDDLFWTKQGNEFKFIQAFILVVYLLIIAIGISYAFITTGVSGLTPIIIFLGYSLSSAITRISGWRFIISVDWVVLLYFWIGLYSCLLFILNLLGVNINNLSSTKLFNKIKFSTSIFHLKNIRKTIFVNILFLCFGLALPLFVYIMPRPYASQSRAENIEEIKNAIENYDISAFTKGKIFKALEDDSVFIETGKAFYPRFYKSGDGEPINQKNIYYFQDYPRLLFYFIGRIRKDVQLEISESPKVFPNNTDVIICATDKDEFWETLFVLVKSDPKIIFFSDSINTYTIHKIFSRSLLLNSN